MRVALNISIFPLSTDMGTFIGITYLDKKTKDYVWKLPDFRVKSTLELIQNILKEPLKFLKDPEKNELALYFMKYSVDFLDIKIHRTFYEISKESIKLVDKSYEEIL